MATATDYKIGDDITITVHTRWSSHFNVPATVAGIHAHDNSLFVRINDPDHFTKCHFVDASTLTRGAKIVPYQRDPMVFS